MSAEALVGQFHPDWIGTSHPAARRSGNRAGSRNGRALTAVDGRHAPPRPHVAAQTLAPILLSVVACRRPGREMYRMPLAPSVRALRVARVSAAGRRPNVLPRDSAETTAPAIRDCARRTF